jgi:hypothetical protein
MTDDGDQTGTGGTGANGSSGGQAPPPAKNDGGQAPPWGDDFTPERAHRTIENLRKFEKEAKELREKNQKLEDAQKSESERVVAERDREKARADAAESRNLRFEVAAEKGLPVKFANRLVGETRAELEADAAKLIEEFDLQGGGGGGGGTDFDAGVRSGGGRQKTGDMNAMIRAAAGRR